MVAYEFRARGVGELVDATFRIYRAHWWTMVKTVGVLLLPIGIIQAGLQALGQLLQQQLQAAGRFDLVAVLATLALSFATRLVASMLGLAGAVAGAAIIRQAADACFGGEPSLASGWRAVRERLGRTIGAGAIYTVLVTLGATFTFCCCGLGGLALAIFLAALMPVIVLEAAPIGQALQRSFKLIGAGFWRVAWVLAVIFLVMLVPVVLLGGGALLLVVQDWQRFGAEIQRNTALSPLAYLYLYIAIAAYTTLVSPLYSVGNTLVYFDLRVRQEGYDLDRATTGAGLTAGGNAGAPLS